MQHRKVWSPRNSELFSGHWAEIDRNNWWTDNSFDQFYLHVENLDKEDGRVHRLYPREIEGYTVHRLKVENGVLMWIYDEVHK